MRVDICEPGRTPADLPFHSDDATASDFLHEGPDTRDCVVIVNGCDVCAVAHRNSSPGLDSYWAGHDNPAQHIFGYHIAESAEEAGWQPCRMSALCHPGTTRSEEHTSELQSLMRISSAVFCLQQK